MLTKKSNIIALITLLLVLLPSLLPASGGPRYRKGHVAAKGVIQSTDGNPYWVEYDDDGNVVAFIGEAAGDLANSTLMSGNDYRLHMAGFMEVEAVHSAHRLLLAREEYESRSFTNAADGPIEKPALLPSTRYVVVRTSDVLYSPQDLILYQSPLNLDLAKQIPDDIRSVLLNQDGVVVHTATVNIGYRVAFYSPLDYDPSEDPTVDMSTAGNLYMGSFNPSDNTLWGPIEGVLVESSLGRGGAPTNSDGRYNLTYYLPPCPGFAFFYDSIMMATLKYRSFNPNGKKLYTYYATAPDNDACSGYGDFGAYGFSLGGLLAQMSVMPIDNSIEGNVTVRTKNFPVDMAMLSGEADLRNSLEKEVLPQGQKTVYGYTPVDFEPVIPQGDIDGDGLVDHAELDEETNQISIWLGGADPEVDPKSLVRQADFNPDFTNQGLVKEVNDADIRNTDTFIYRVSNGQLFSARNGLLGNDVSNTTDTTINYRHIIRGPRKTSTFQSDIEKWQASTNVNEELRGWQADHIRTGEQLKVVMLNRATGYIGSSIATYGENTEKGGIISFTPENIHMLPPNLKIKVERRTRIEAGANKNNDRVYTIGFEGSGLTSDTYIVITTEWFDHDGSPLPEDLPGYTGRLAKVVDFDQLGQASGQIANFPIRPGRNQVVVKLPQEELDTAHYYVHVNGEAMEGQPDFASEADFATTGAGEGLLQYRPKHYVPVQVPLYDKELTETAERLRQQAIAQGADPADLPEVQPVYQWPYRPEMQFSLFDLKQLEYVDQQDTDGDNQYDLIGAEGRVDIGYAENYNFLYEILEDDLPMLEQFGPDRELVFGLGQQEILATTGEGLYSLDFSNIDFSLVDPEELIALRLYQNGDAANILWEYGISMVDLDVDSDNSDGLNPPSRSAAEDQAEYSFPVTDHSRRAMGKMIGVHTGNADGDKRPDCIDFHYEADGTETPPGFVPLVLELPDTIDRDEAKVRFIYSASDPNGEMHIEEGETVYDTTYQLPPGHLRLWKIDNSKDVDRNVSDINKGGHFINGHTSATLAEYKFSDLVNHHAPQANDHTVTLFVEGIRATTTSNDQRILVEVDPDGDGESGFISADSVNVSVVDMKLALDLNRDGVVSFEDDGADKTTPYQPFRFWLNNDFDVVSNNGAIRLDETKCPDPADADEAICEQWDEAPQWTESHPPQYGDTPPDYSTHSNIYDSNIGMIECERDLEDFAPLALKIEGLPRDGNGRIQLPEDWELKVRAKNVGINLFKGEWKDGIDYLTQKAIAEKQVKHESNLYLFTVKDGQEQVLLYGNEQYNTESGVEFDENGITRLIFEGIQTSPISDPEINEPEDNYVEIYLKNGEQEVPMVMAYINIQDVKHYYDHFTAGKGYYGEVPEVAEVVHLGTPILNDSDADLENDILLVHGWRMRYWERVSFAETSFKRLYWSGYKGHFGTFSWPTGWFEKPAHVYNYLTLVAKYIRGYEQNYDHSEMVARFAGVPLAAKLKDLDAEYVNVHVMAHSMGNVVTSEALKIAIPDANVKSPVVSYAACMPASAAGAYSSDAFENTHLMILSPGWDWVNNQVISINENECMGIRTAEEAWRCYNIAGDSWLDRDYDMPPDKYRFAVPNEHHGFSKYNEDVSSEELERPYYFRNYNWAQKVNVYNFYNGEDAALSSWELNQLTKSDSGIIAFEDEKSWDQQYVFKYQWSIVGGCDLACRVLGDQGNTAIVKDLYYYTAVDEEFDGTGEFPENEEERIELFWSEDAVTGEVGYKDTIRILSHIIPARTKAMGQMRVNGSSFMEPLDMHSDYGLTKSNLDHSAIFHSTFYLRGEFWDDLLERFIE